MLYLRSSLSIFILLMGTCFPGDLKNAAKEQTKAAKYVVFNARKT